jgi:uncharacterized membrane protein
MSNQSYQFAQVSGPSVQWRLKRNCSVTPVQLGWMYLSLCTVSLGIGVFFWMQGATLVLAFAGLEVAVVGLAFLAYARHAADGEMISLQGSNLVVELETAGRLVEPKSGDQSLIELSGQGQTIEVGRFVRPELRQVLAREIRKALRSA